VKLPASRRGWLLAAACAASRPAWAAASADADDSLVRRGRPLAFARDHGAHPGAAIEWWYLTGWLGSEAAPRYGFQITFFRRRIAAADALQSRLAARHLLFAHAALTDLERGTHHHSQRLVRWDGRSTTALARCAVDDMALTVQRWAFERRGATALAARIDGAFEIDLALTPTQPLLLQGDAGFSRKGALEPHASHYYSQPQLAVQARLAIGNRRDEGRGRAWLDHEWSDALMPPDAVGWDWIGSNGFDGSALTAFRLRAADGRALWAGGSHRDAGGRLRIFSADEVRFEPERHWRSGTSGARYPVRWRVTTPAGSFVVNALLDAQELDHRGSTGVLYWEGLAELLAAGGQRVGLGYLEMTGYGQRLRLT
jgi:predicted secreted hydrolase